MATLQKPQYTRFEMTLKPEGGIAEWIQGLPEGQRSPEVKRMLVEMIWDEVSCLYHDQPGKLDTWALKLKADIGSVGFDRITNR